MTEEIVNGVDVSGCCLYKDGICLTDKGKCTSMCDYGAYAREEELKRLEQENAKLKAKLKAKLEKIKEIAEIALKANYCNNCDGVGLPECMDAECHTYALDKIMDIIEGAEDE